MVHVVGEMKAAISHLIEYYSVLLLICGGSYLIAEQQFNYRYRYSFWPPLSWQQAKQSTPSFSSWKEQDLHFEVSISNAHSYRSLKEALDDILWQKEGENVLVKVAAEKSIWSTWAQGLDRACLTMSLLEAETLLCGWASKKSANVQHGWLLIIDNNSYYYIVNAWSDKELDEQSAALLLSLLDSFALQGQQSWEAGVISKLQQRSFYEQFEAVYSREFDVQIPQKLIFRKDRAQWSSPRWQAIEAMNKTLMARELIVIGKDRTASMIERFYFFLFRSNISSFSRILKLIPAPLALWHPKKLAYGEGEKSDELAFATAEDDPEEEFVQEATSAQDPTEPENDIDFSYLFENQENTETDAQEEEDYSALFSLGEEDNLAQSSSETETVSEEFEQEETVESEQSSQIQESSQIEETTAESSLQRWIKLEQRRPPSASKMTSLATDPLVGTEKLYQLLYKLQDKKISKKEDFDPLFLEPPLMEFWQEETDLQTLYLNAVLLLSQLGYRSALLYSWEYKTTLLAIETAGAGARFSWFSRSYLLFDLSEKVYAGWAPNSALDLQKWQVLSFPSFSRQAP